LESLPNFAPHNNELTTKIGSQLYAFHHNLKQHVKELGHCYRSYLHHLLMHEFCHCLARAIILVFLVIFWHWQEFIQCFDYIHILAWDGLAVANVGLWRIGQP